MAKKANHRIYLAVVGAGNCSPEIYQLAQLVGAEAALRGWVVVTGGLGGVMEGAAKGAKTAGGLTIGIVPGPDRKEANSYMDFTIATNMGHARNAVLVNTADALIAVDGEFGTLSEVAIGLKLGKPVVGLKTAWDIPGVRVAANPADAVEKVSKLIG